MIGDVLLIEQKHERVARELAARIHRRRQERLVVAIGGESGSGKSEIAETLRAVLRTENLRVKILHMDNYYIVSPADRGEHRRRLGMEAVGLHEIDWDLVEENVAAFRAGKPTTIPFLDLFTNQEDKLVTDFKPVDLLIIEGLYACNAPADVRVHIDLTYHQTKKAQIKRKKEKVDAFRFEVLEKEHQVVSTLRAKTDYFVTPGFTVVDNTDKQAPPDAEPAGRMLFCSGTLPLVVGKRKGNLHVTEHAGGVANAIGSVYRAYDSIWFGHLPLPADFSRGDRAAVTRQLKQERAMHPLALPEAVDKAAAAFCAQTLWPLFHYRPESCTFDPDGWAAYVRYNKAYCEAIRRQVQPDDTLWIHDYQLMLLPALLRRHRPDANIGFFLHTPFPSFELFRLLPWRRDLLEGVLAADLVGFHIYEYTRHFQSSVFRLLGHESKLGSIICGSHLTHTDAFSLGVDTAAFARLGKTPDARRRAARLREAAGKCAIVASIDRLEPARGIAEKLDMIEALLRTRPRFRTRVVFRLHFFDGAGGAAGRHYRREIEQRIDAINRAWGTAAWTPVTAAFGQAPQQALIALYAVADILLVTSLRDGMNLIGKEYIAARDSDRGVVIMSEMAGGARELAEAILINPCDIAAGAAALETALTMPARRQAESFKRLRQRMERNSALRWSVEFCEGLKSVKVRQARIRSRAFTARTLARVQADYHHARRRLFVLDYNGTLVPAPRDGHSKPPDAKAQAILALLAGNKRNRVAVITDNTRELMDAWFTDSKIDLITCSDAAFRRAGQWTAQQQLANDWKDDARPIFERYVVRTPGSYMDEKRYALIWHFENAVKELGEVRARELIEDLKGFAGMQTLLVNEGEGFIEMKNAETHKASLLQDYLGDSEWDFVYAAGDDLSNETLFESLPAHACTVRIGAALTNARYSLPDQSALLPVLKALAGPA